MHVLVQTDGFLYHPQGYQAAVYDDKIWPKQAPVATLGLASVRRFNTFVVPSSAVGDASATWCLARYNTLSACLSCIASYSCPRCLLLHGCRSVFLPPRATHHHRLLVHLYCLIRRRARLPSPPLWYKGLSPLPRAQLTGVWQVHASAYHPACVCQVCALFSWMWACGWWIRLTLSSAYRYSRSATSEVDVSERLDGDGQQHEP